jgi:glycosyltransferase involved in cell wall biosynthesis
MVTARGIAAVCCMTEMDMAEAVLAHHPDDFDANVSVPDVPAAPRPFHHPLRIALFSGNYNYVRDGANMTLNRLVAFLERQHIAVRVYAPTVPEPAFAPAGTLISVPSIPLPRRKEYRLGLGLPAHVIDDLRAFGPNLFHLSAPDLIGRSALKLARQWQIPAVASYHTRFESYLPYYGLSWLQPAVMSYLRRFYRQCEQLYAPTDCCAATLRELGFNDDVRVWSRGIDRTRFAPQKRDPAWRAEKGFADSDVVVAFVGRLVLEKGLDLFCDVMERLAANGVKHRILIVGDGPERALLEQRLPAAVFTGHLEGGDLERAYASSEIFFNPSVTESFGNVTLEAMACGVPTVCATATGSRDLVRDGVTGLLIAPERRDEFAAAITRLVHDETLRRRMGLAARDASANYDWEKVMAGLLSHYREIHASSSVAIRAIAAANAPFRPRLVAQE